jgi:uncharacterized protein (DUF1501 family)
MAINRREFLKTSAAAVGLGLSGTWLKTFAETKKIASTDASERVMVVINLFGGNDGLNTVIPLEQYDRYRVLRPTLGVDRAQALALPNSGDLAFHPRMQPLHDLYTQNKVAIINAVGVPGNSRGLFDHAAGQYEFQSCDIQYDTSKKPSGWLGRYLDRVPEQQISPGVDLGGGKLILTGERRSPVSISTLEEFQLKYSFDETNRKKSYTSIMKSPYPSSVVAETNRKFRTQALEQSAIIQNKISGYQAMVQYPADSYIAYQLYQCAQLIWADLGVRAMAVGFGDFDNHYGQLGTHDNLLAELSASISAFYRDIDAHGLADRVLVLTISEFGRRAYENNDVGTDHGYASVAMAIGNAVKPGVHGSYPRLDDASLVFDGNLDVHTDFRSVYATAIAKFLDADPVPAVGGNFPLLDYL